MFLSSQPWNKKEKVRSKGSESGKRCTCACTCTSNMALKMAMLRRHLIFVECGTLSYFCRCASSSRSFYGLICTVQLTRNLNVSVEYERFYSRVSMCETRALEHSYSNSSFTRRSDPSHSNARTRTRALQYSYSTYSTRLDSN